MTNLTQEEINNSKIKKASIFAIAVSLVLLSLKIYAYKLTSSCAIHASAMDSLMDTVVSFVNLIAVYMLSMKKSHTAPFGWDKIAVLVATLQAVIISFLAFEIIHEGYEHFFSPHHHMDFSQELLIVPMIAFFISLALILFQKKVVKETGSLVIQADMIHFVSDLYSNIVLLVGFIFINYFQIYWLDSVLGALIGVYLIFSIIPLLKTAFLSLLDLNFKREQRLIIEALKSHNYAFSENEIQAIFSGAKFVIHVKLRPELHQEIENIQKLILQFSHISTGNDCESHQCHHVKDTIQSTKAIEVRFYL